MSKMTEENMKKAHKAVKNMVRAVDLQVDTVSVDKTGNVGGYFLSNNKSITINYVPGDEKWNNWSESDNVLIHEQKHRDNYWKSMHAYAVNSEQAYKLDMHDEISANICSLVALRQKYLETGDISVFDGTEGGRFAFYKEAIQKGEIDPSSPYHEDFDKDMRLIVNGTQQMWQKNFASDYVKQNLNSMQRYVDKEGQYAAYWDENYQKSLKVAYNIGGVDFTQYMEKDVEIPWRANHTMVNDVINDYDYYQEKYSINDAQVFEKSGFSPYDGSISLQEYKKLLQHQMAMRAFGSGYNYEKPDGSVATYTPQEYMQSLCSPQQIAEDISSYNGLISPNNEEHEKYKKMFPTFEDFHKYTYEDYISEYQGCYDKAAEFNEAFIDKMVEYQAHEYAKTGKEFPKEDNRENYQTALKKMYGASYELMKPEEHRTMKTDLSDKAVCIMNDTNKSWFDKTWDEVKRQCTYVTDQNGGERYVGLWGKITQEVKEAKGSVIGWFKPGARASGTVQNKPTHPVNTQKPVYREWQNKDGFRVSEVLHRQIPDMNASIISKPTRNHKMERLHIEQPDNLRVVQDLPQIKIPTKSKTAGQMKSDAVKSKTSASYEDAENDAVNNASLRQIMKSDAQKAQSLSQNIGKQYLHTGQKKKVEIGRKEISQTQFFKNLYHNIINH